MIYQIKQEQGYKMTEKRKLEYRVQELTAEQQAYYDDMVENMGFPHIIAKAFAMRDPEDYQEMLSPYLLADMEKGANYMFEALLNKRDICVVADYDADGATSCSIMIKGLLGFGQSTDNIHYFLPHRIKHGYGLQPSVIDEMLLNYPNVEIIVTVDNGISAVAGVDYAVSKGIQVLVTDHHAEGDYRPENAVAIINPNRKDCTFPSKALAGCGVAFYLIWTLSQMFKEAAKKAQGKYTDSQWAIIKKAAQFNPDVLRDYLAIGTIADVVKLDANNRLLVQSGLDRIRNGQANIGIQALLTAKKLHYKLPAFSTEDIAFSIGPTINAEGRLKDMTLMVRMMLSENRADCMTMANEACSNNEKRKDIEVDMVEAAMSQLDLNNPVYRFSCAILIPDGHEGVVGIVASRVKDKLYRPTIAFVSIEEEHDGHPLIKGSGRSIQGLHIRDAIDYVTKKSPDCVVKFGGHAMAAGLTIRKDKLPDFQKYFDEYCEMIFEGVEPSLCHIVDEVLDLSAVSIDDIDELNMYIWGQGHTKPMYYGRFFIQSQELTKNKQHLSLKLVQESTGAIVEAMWFRKDYLIAEPYLDCVYTLSVKRYGGAPCIQLMLTDAVPLESDD